MRSPLPAGTRSAPLALTALALAIALTLVACTDATRPICEPGVPCAHASEAACAAGLEATLYGRAAFADGTCVARDDATCRNSALTCAYFGQCAFSPTAPTTTRACQARTDRDFHASRDPACAAGTCVAASDADCTAAAICLEEGRCTAKNTLCVGTATSCKDSTLCQTLGWCAPHPNGQCRPATPADCQASARCDSFGDCGLRGDTCTACNRSDACRTDGLCATVGGICRATETNHCRPSEACKTSGRCRALHGACVR